MITRRLLGPLAIALLALPLAACTSGTGGAGGSTVATSLCDTDPRAMTYAVGLSQTVMDGTMKVSFVDAMPAPPAESLNEWTVQLTDGNGDPVSGATITVKPWMPDMGHGSSVTPQVTPMTTAGEYQVSLIDLFMPGIWTNTFTITTASEPVTTAVFTFCIDG
jgi:hypothetical protein